jgi:hypothetical protein
MGSIISKINDDYLEYKELCKLLSIEPRDIREMYSHENDILSEYKCESTYELFNKIERINRIDENISSIF